MDKKEYNGLYPLTANELPTIDGMHYVGHLVDMDGSGWVTREMAQQILDLINAELNQQ